MDLSNIKLICFIFATTITIIVIKLCFWTQESTSSTNLRHWSHSLSTEDRIITPTTRTSKNKVTHINFLKVHKAGSTTIQNMLFRFAIRYNLNVLLPKRGNFFKNAEDAVQIPHAEHFDIFAIHTIYNQTLINILLPNDTRNIAIVREPVQLFISSAFYSRDIWHHPYLENIPRLNFIHELVKNPDLYEPKKPFSPTRNSMGWDFGFQGDMKFNETKRISKYLDYLNNQFSLVMLMEKFDESLILLRRLLNWSHLDIIYKQVNQHTHKPVTFTQEEKTSFRKTCFMDFAIYEFFKIRFEEKLNKVEEDFQEELDHFRNILIKVKKFCNESKDGDFLFVEKSNWSDKFNITLTECSKMSQHELPLVDELRMTQYKRHNITVL